MKESFSLRKRILSFKYAFNGLLVLVKEEHNARIHLLATIVVILAGFLFNLSKVDWILVVLAIGFVLAMELINSAVENLADFVTKERHDEIKKTKDLAAGGVLVAAHTAFIVGLVVFIPKIIEFF
jgi:diacylglycerol kinase